MCAPYTRKVLHFRFDRATFNRCVRDRPRLCPLAKIAFTEAVIPVSRRPFASRRWGMTASAVLRESETIRRLHEQVGCRATKWRAYAFTARCLKRPEQPSALVRPPLGRKSSLETCAHPSRCLPPERGVI